jgi:antitoxin YefM
MSTKAQMTTLTATDARREFFNLVKRTTSGHKIYRIRHRSGSVVLMSEDDYESLMESMELLAIPGFRASMKRSVAQMKRGDTLSFAEVL